MIGSIEELTRQKKEVVANIKKKEIDRLKLIDKDYLLNQKFLQDPNIIIDGFDFYVEQIDKFLEMKYEAIKG